MSQPFILGVNYWPRRKAMYWWRDFDAQEVRDEFGVIADLGMKVVRIFLLWDDWMPTPDAVDATCLVNLGTVLDIAQENALGLDITFFTGHMSGPNWSPRWLLADADAPFPAQTVRQVVSDAVVVNNSYRNMYHDPVALDAARLMLDTVVGAYKNHPAVWMWNLGNEPDLFAWANTHTDGQAWVREMTQRIKAQDTTHPVTCGLHVESLTKDNSLRVNEIYAETDVAVMHGYPMYADWSRHALDPDFVPFLCALTSALCGKPTLMEEWGGCTTDQPSSEVWEWIGYGRQYRQFMASEQDLADYVAQVLPKLVEVGSTGAMMWCFADYIPELWGKPPCDESRHERFFGLVRPDGTLKPHAEVIRQFAATQPTAQPAVRTVSLGMDGDTYYTDADKHIRALYQAYLAAYEA